ncbi:MAG TPA: peptidylprolyl isomerase [Polyangiales bacterium]|nr:peptidylprolyl isomerase [Polyangiales bacterium]
MPISRCWTGSIAVLLAACTGPSPSPSPEPQAAAPKLTMDQVLAAAKPDDWRSPDPENTLYMELPGGEIVIELAPQFAPRHVANIRTLVREKFFDGLAIVRVQDNYVVQWGDSEGKKPIGTAQRTLAPEFTRAAEGLSFHALPDRDTYAPEVGFVDGFPAARDRASGTAWAVHCYGMLGVGRDDAADSGGGTELYVVSGHAPRHLDRNVTLAGRVLLGMELLSALPRGHGKMGFYEASEQKPIIARVRVAADVPVQERKKLLLLRTDSPTFDALVESRRNRTESWFKQPAGHIEVCNVPLQSGVMHSGLSTIRKMGD